MTITGSLEFINLFYPIKLFIFKDDIEYIDLWPHYDELFKKLNGGKASMIDDALSIEIRADEASEKVIKYEVAETYKVILISSGDATSNVGAYLPNVLQRLNGRRVIVNITEDCIKIEPDPTDEVYGVYFTRDNLCSIPKDDVAKICKPGTLDACIFLILSADGFECGKFDSFASRELLERRAQGQLRAGRIGDCTILGRREPPKKPLDMGRFTGLLKLAEDSEKYCGWTLKYCGDEMDRQLGFKPATTKVIRITFDVNDDKTDATFCVVGVDFSCGFSVDRGGKDRFGRVNYIKFHGFMGQEFIIYKDEPPK